MLGARCKNKWVGPQSHIRAHNTPPASHLTRHRTRKNIFLSTHEIIDIKEILCTLARPWCIFMLFHSWHRSCQHQHSLYPPQMANGSNPHNQQLINWFRLHFYEDFGDKTLWHMTSNWWKQQPLTLIMSTPRRLPVMWWPSHFISMSFYRS